MERKIRDQATEMSALRKEREALQKQTSDMLRRMELIEKRPATRGAVRPPAAGTAKVTDDDTDGTFGAEDENRRRPRDYEGCFNCDAMDHDSRNCPEPRRARGRGRGRGGGHGRGRGRGAGRDDAAVSDGNQSGAAEETKVAGPATKAAATPKKKKVAIAPVSDAGATTKTD